MAILFCMCSNRTMTRCRQLQYIQHCSGTLIEWSRDAIKLDNAPRLRIWGREFRSGDVVRSIHPNTEIAAQIGLLFTTLNTVLPLPLFQELQKTVIIKE